MFLAIIIALLAASAFAQSPPQGRVEANPPDGCLLAYSWNDGPLATDWSGKARHGTNKGTVTWNGANVAVAGTYVYAPQVAIINPAGPFGVSFWMKPTGELWVGYFELTADKGFIFIAGQNDATYPGYFGFRESTAIVSAASELRPDALNGKWNHIAMNYNAGDRSAAGSYEVWLNGAKITLKNGNAIGAGSFLAGSNVVAKTSNEGAMTGSMDEFYVFNRMLAASEIKNLYQQGKAEGK